MQHLREVPITEIDDAMRNHIERAARQCGCNFTILEGQVTGSMLIVLHSGERPRPAVIETYEREEVLALHVSGDQKQ